MNTATHTLLTTLRVQGKTAPEVSSLLAADFRTTTNLDRKGLAAHLLTTGLYDRLDDARASLDLPAPLRSGISKLFFTLQSGIDYLGTHDSLEVASQAEQLLGALVLLGVLMPEEKDGVLALGGGYLLERLTAEEIEASWAADDRREQTLALRQQVADGYNAAMALLEQAASTGQEPPATADLLALFQSALEA